MAIESSSTINNNNTSSNNPDSYIGSLLSVTSKCEIRYEGVLYYINTQDSTLGLKNVRSYGTEGRKKDGPQVPPSDKVYQYILFRGSDIKDLQVKANPQAQKEEPIYNDPAIIQTNYYGQSSLSPKPIPGGNESVPTHTSIPPNYSGTQLGTLGLPPSAYNAMSSNSMPTQWQGYIAPSSAAGPQIHSLSSRTVQNQASAPIVPSKPPNNVSPHLLATSSSLYLNSTTAPSSEQFSTLFTDYHYSKLPNSHQSTLINSNGLSMPFPLPYQTNNFEAPVVNEVVPNPTSSLPPQPSSYPLSSVSEPISEPPLKQQPVFLTPNQFSQPKLSDLSLDNNSCFNQKYVGANISSPATTSAVQPPLLPLPPSSQKLQYSPQIMEEFDFQAMNEKFNKDEVWGHLGKTNQRDLSEGILEKGSSSEGSGEMDPSLASKSEPKPAYNKDDFFDTISCNSVGRGSRDGQRRPTERIKLNSETFGFQQRTHFGHDGYGAGRHGYRGQHHQGRGHNYHMRGRGNHMPR